MESAVSVWSGWKETLIFVKPDTVIRWQRKRFKEHWTRLSRNGKPGRPATSKDVQELIRTLSTMNSTWGSPHTELFLFTHGVLGTGRTPRTYLDAEGSADLGGGGRFDEEHARKPRNMPGQFDFGPQRVCWLSQVVTDWMGDEGTLLSLNASVRHPNVVGGTNTVFGEVMKKYVEDGKHLVEVYAQNKNQSGLTTAFGAATVALPSKR